jgi:uncharacterized protein (TIGR02145 family)
MTGANCDECKNSLMTGDSCDECKNSLMTGANCDECKNNKLGQNCDIDTVVINGKTWTAKNMYGTIGNDGSTITCYANTQKAPDGDPEFIKNYGCLYTWQEAMKVCPKGWHLPTKAEFETLLKDVGDGISSSKNLRAQSWNQGQDTYGFGVLPAGAYSDGAYYEFGSYARFWSKTDYTGSGCSSTCAYDLRILDTLAGTGFGNKAYGYSVRCLKDYE